MKILRFHEYKNALSQIKLLFDAHSIPFVVMKGIAIEKEIYGDRPYLRDFSDMDILVFPQQASLALSLLKSIGYQLESGDEEDFVDKFLKRGDREHHFPPLIKKKRALNIVLEVHVDFVPGWIFNIRHFKAEQILARSYVNEFGIPVLDDYDTVLFMMPHLVKHYVFQMVMDFAVGKTDAQIYLRSLHEIALFLYKKKEFLSRNELEKRVLEYEARNELAFVCSILKEIYPSLNHILDIHFPEDTRACFSSRFSRMALTEFKVSDILLGSRRTVVRLCIKGLQKDAFPLPLCS